MRRFDFGLLPCTLAALLAGGCERDSANDPVHASSSEVGKAKVEPSESTAEGEREREVERPKLVVLVVVDQMRFDYFERFGGQWQHAFTKLREQGRFFTQAHHAHAMTETAPGHATIATGTHPAKHGIVANAWWDRASNRKVNSVDDPAVAIFGNDGDVGLSPVNSLRSGVGDWLQANNPEAIVVSLAVKDRAAILLGGKRPDIAVWYDDDVGGFTTSSYYAEALPPWVAAYNEKGRAEALYGEAGWTLSRPDDAYGSSRRQTEPELVSTFSGFSLTKQFPHVIAVEGKQPRNVVRDTPFGDQMLLELARDAIAATHIGADAVPDLLFIGISGADYAGHRYGPDSVEVHDYFLRLDEQLGAFVDDLDRQFGDDYVLILTSDHGVAPMPEHSDIPTAGRFVASKEVPKLLAAAAKAVGLKQVPEDEYTHGIDLLFSQSVDEPTRIRFRAELARLLREREEIADAWTLDEIAGSETRNEYAQAWRASVHPQRSSDINLQFAPGVVMYPEGTGHGTPYPYDQHVPLVIRGAGRGGVDDRAVKTVDIAPTIATLVGATVPAEVDGKPISLD